LLKGRVAGLWTGFTRKSILFRECLPPFGHDLLKDGLVASIRRELGFK
jgi:hypothetical protein